MLHVTVCVSFDPTVSEACDQNQNQNQKKKLNKENLVKHERNKLDKQISIEKLR